MTLESIGQICGILVLIVAVINTQLPTRFHMLIGLSILNFLSAVNQILIGAGITAGLICMVAVIHCPINAFKLKKGLQSSLAETVIWCILYLAAWAVGFVLSILDRGFSPINLLPLLATFLFFGTVFFPRERDMRICSLFNVSIYFIYDCLNMNVAAVAKLFCITSTLIALYRYRDKKKQFF